MKKTEKTFDSVRLMRTLRDALSKEMRGLTFEEQRQMIRERLQTSQTSLPGAGRDKARDTDCTCYSVPLR